MEVDPAGSVKKGKKTNQLIFGYDSVHICAFHLQVATKSELKLGDYLRGWAFALEVPLSTALQAFQAMGLSLGPDRAGGGPPPSSTSVIQGGVTPPTAPREEILPQSLPHLKQLQKLLRWRRMRSHHEFGYSGSNVPVFCQCLESFSSVPSPWTPTYSFSNNCRMGSLGGPPEVASHLQAAYNSRRLAGDRTQ